MKIRFLGQSGYVLRTENTQIILDPYLSDSVNRVAGRPRTLPIPMLPRDVCCDAVICSHDHLDHLDPDTVSAIPKGQRFITTSEGKQHLGQLGQTNVSVLRVGESITVGDCKLTAVFADHTVEAFGLILQAEEKTLYFSGDTLYHEKLFDIAGYHPELAFICINGRLGNMNAQEAVQLANRIGAKVSIPNHYDMFASNSEDPRKFTDAVPHSRVLEFNREYEFSDILMEV
jgi:L-ascorbate metabolism protein UlaG (beta-lactamase superfamily)